MDCDDDVIVISVRMYKFFMAHGKTGMKAKELYEHLIFTSRLQYGNTDVKANNKYLMKGLGWGVPTLKIAKSFLRGAGLIEYFQAQDEQSGKFGISTILVKKMWDEESLSAWLERKLDRENSHVENSMDNEIVDNSEINFTDKPVDKTGGLEIEPPVNQIENKPVVTFTALRSNRPTGSRKQTNKERERETYKKEKEERTRESSPSIPPAVSFSEFPKFCKYLESLIELDGKGSFFFPQAAKASLEHFTKLRSFKWTFEQFENYRVKKTTAQIRRFCESDLPKYLNWAHASAPKEIKKTPSVVRICPVCGSEQPSSGMINYCPRCTLPSNEFKDLEKIEEHRQWYEEYQNRDEATG